MEHFDDLETRAPEAREAALMAALPAIIGAILAVTCATVEELGYMDEVVGAFAEIFKAMGVNDQLAQILGAVLFSVILIVITAGCGYASYSAISGAAGAASSATNAGTAAANTARSAGLVMEMTCTLLEVITEIGGAVAGILSSYFMFQALSAGSRETEYRGELTLHKEESEELTDRLKGEADKRTTNYDLVSLMQKNNAKSDQQLISYI